MNILSALRDVYEECKPIFDYEIYALGYTDKDIEEAIQENVFEELTGVNCIPCRIFYLVYYDKEFDLYFRLYKNSEDVITKYFVGTDFEHGYFYGLTLQNILGISTQVPAVTYIKSTRATAVVEFAQYRIEPDADYKPEDFDYIKLAMINANRGCIEYDIRGKIAELERKCTDKAKLARYEQREKANPWNACNLTYRP